MYKFRLPILIDILGVYNAIVLNLHNNNNNVTWSENFENFLDRFVHLFIYYYYLYSLLYPQNISYKSRLSSNTLWTHNREISKVVRNCRMICIIFTNIYYNEFLLQSKINRAENFIVLHLILFSRPQRNLNARQGSTRLGGWK